MGVSVARVLELPALREARLIAGRGGLSNEVDGIGLMESLDSIEWLTARKLIINNARAFASCSGEEWAALVESFVERGVSGLVVKLGRYVSSVPALALERADDLAFPVIVPPFDIEPAQIISDVYFELFSSDDAAADGGTARADAVLRDIALGREDWRVLRANVVGLGWQVSRPHGVAAVQGGATGPAGTGAFRDACREAGFPYGFHAGARFVAVAMLDGEADPPSELHDRGVRLHGLLSERFPAGAWRIGLGGVHDSLLALPECCAEANRALAVSGAVEGAQEVVGFDDLGFLGILLESRNRERTERAYKRAFGLLARHDEDAGTAYAQTVRAYALCGGSSKRTAELLYVHENTVRYRIAAAKEILDAGRFGAGLELNFELLCLLCRLRQEHAFE